MRILGIDPGSRVTGWGLILQEGTQSRRIASGTIRLDTGRLNANSALSERLLGLDTALRALLGEHRPEACAVESIFTARNARSALVLGHARGVILCAIAAAGLPLHEYTPAQVKQTVAGTGRADKEQINRMVCMLLGRQDKLAEDEADALAVAITHGATVRLANTTQATVRLAKTSKAASRAAVKLQDATGTVAALRRGRP